MIQSLFYLPAFRSLVLNFTPQNEVKNEEKLLDTDSNGYNERRAKIVEFMQELRKLFALMVSSQRKYVDPTRAVEILRGSTRFGSLQQQNKDLFSVEANNQQDVSEFTHIVLEWVEEAFKRGDKPPQCNSSKDEHMMEADCEKENNEEKVVPKDESENKDDACSDDNPMTKLFYGKVLIEGWRLNGGTSEREEAFGQWPLQVNTFTNIHESLENSTAHESIENAPEPQQQQQQKMSGQERWFTRLPPVLFFDLSRYQYNTERKTAEKIHNRLEFPEHIFMDRYVAANKHITRVKRDEVRGLKEKRALLRARLNKFSSYGVDGADNSEETKMPLPQILESALAFACTPSTMPANTGCGAPIPVASSASTLMQVDSPCGSPRVTPAPSLTSLTAPAASMPGDSEIPMDAMDVEMSVSPEKETTTTNDNSGGNSTSAPQTATSVVDCDNRASGFNQKTASSQEADPSPRHVSETELRVLQNCLSRWKQEVQQDMRDLETAIQQIDAQIENMYTDESLQNLEYQLHAVMVHEGCIDSGHYWAYVLDHKRKVS